uniref:Angiomotin n=1 Tax=Cacopsylla melanoneura TaxID=428564 RepID=A0A8D9EY02_9HEMI
MNSQPQKSRYMYSQKSPAVTPSLSGSETDVSTSTENLSFEEQYVMRNTTRQEPQGQENRNSLDSASYNTLIIHEENRLSGAGTPPGYQMSKVSSPGTSSRKSPASTAAASASSERGVREITQIPDDYLSQSQVLKHLAKEVKVVSPGREDSNTSNSSKHYTSLSGLKTSGKKCLRSKSQPDLSQLEQSGHKGEAGQSLGASSSRKEQRYMQMIERLMQENSGLKLELEACYQRVSKSQKLEQEVGKVHRAHEDLVESCERRERLERAARVRLQGEVRRLQEANRSLQSHAELLSNQVVSLRNVDSTLDMPEIARREALISQLIAQNKELIAAKDRQEIELAAQRATLEEQRTHIDILDTALTNAQSNVVRLEEECRKKQLYVERVAQLQRALSSLQLASDRREQTERKLRLQLERELRNERARNSNTHDASGSDGDPGENIGDLKRRLREKDEKIMRLEGEVAKWEQRYLEESELRQAAIDAASIPKDAKIAALEKTSMESEKLIAEARSDKLKQMDEVHAANKKVSDLESRMKELESKLAERDAMIRVLQKKHHGHTTGYDKDSFLHHSPRSSELTNDDLVGPVSSGSMFTTSTGFGSSASYTGSVDSAFHHHHHHSHSTRSNKYSSSANQSFDAKSLDDQLKELDSQLLSKASLIQALRQEKEKYPNHYWRV